MYSLYIKFQEKIFTGKRIIQLWNFGNFGISEIIPKNLVTLRFLKVSLHELKFGCKTFQLSHWPNFYFDPAYSNTRLPWNTTRLKTNAQNCILFFISSKFFWSVSSLFVNFWCSLSMKEIALNIIFSKLRKGGQFWHQNLVRHSEA